MTDPRGAVTIRAGTAGDAPAIRALYQAVGARAGGIARAPDEVTAGYVEGFIAKQESNARALRLYESLGFVREGRMERRIRTPLGTGVEADIPMAWFPKDRG